MSQSTETSKVGYTFGHAKSATSSHASRTADVDAAFLLPHLQPDFRILDVGCGPGTITAGLCKYVPSGQVTGIDISPNVLAEADRNASNLPEGRPKNLEFRCVDVVRGFDELTSKEQRELNGESSELSGIPPEWKHSFDVVYESQTLVHLPDPTNVIKTLRQLLKPGSGILATRDYDVGTMIFWPDPSGKLARWSEYNALLVSKGGGCIFGGREVPCWVAGAGFESSQLQVSASGVVYRGEQRKWWGDLHAQRYSEGQFMREGLTKKCGVSEQECDEVKKALEHFADDPNGTYFMTAVEALARV